MKKEWQILRPDTHYVEMLGMILKQPGGKTGKTCHAIHFNVDTGIPLKEDFDRIALRLRWNRWNGRKTAQMVIEET